MNNYTRIGCAVLLSIGVASLGACSWSKRTASGRVYQKETPAQSKRYAMTFKEIRKAAKGGDADAQYALGFMYYYGKQVGRDMTAAKNWIRRAAVQGQPRAVTALKLMGEKAPTVKPRLAFRKRTITKKHSRVKTSRIKTVAMKKPAAFSKKQHGPGPQPSTKAVKKTVKLAKKSKATKVTTKTTKTTPKVIAKATKKTTPKVATLTKVAETSHTTTPTTAKPTLKMATATTVTAIAFGKTENMLLNKRDDHFTLQLLGSHSITQIENVITENHLDM